MSIRVTPVIFLLDICNGFVMLGLFVSYSAHERLKRNPTNRLQIFDSINISLSVVLTSLFLLWAAGCLLGSYFGNYSVFLNPMRQSFKSLLTLEMLIDSIQKTMGFLVLGLASFQMATLGNHDTLIPWGGSCVTIGLLQGVSMCIMAGIFKGLNGWIILYLFSALISLMLWVFGMMSVVIIGKNKAPEGITGHLSNQVVRWNVRLCLMVLLGSALDLLYKTVLVLMEINLVVKTQILIDILSLGKSISSVIIVFAVYATRIPRDKSYSTRILN